MTIVTRSSISTGSTRPVRAAPRRCASCETPLSEAEPAWCGPCEFSWVRHSGHGALRFGHRLDWALGITWLHLARPEERRLVHNLKYGGSAFLGIQLGRIMARECAQTLDMASATQWSVVPVPLHRKRQRQRGYNQSEMLAKGWSQVTGAPMLSLLERPHAGQSLTRFGRAGRIREGLNPFVWKAPDSDSTVPDAGILIMDDVMTTGSTLERAHSAIRQYWSGPLGYLTLLDANR